MVNDIERYNFWFLEMGQVPLDSKAGFSEPIKNFLPEKDETKDKNPEVFTGNVLVQK